MVALEASDKQGGTLAAVSYWRQYIAACEVGRQVSSSQRCILLVHDCTSQQQSKVQYVRHVMHVITLQSLQLLTGCCQFVVSLLMLQRARPETGWRETVRTVTWIADALGSDGSQRPGWPLRPGPSRGSRRRLRSGALLFDFALGRWCRASQTRCMMSMRGVMTGSHTGGGQLQSKGTARPMPVRQPNKGLDHESEARSVPAVPGHRTVRARPLGPRIPEAMAVRFAVHLPAQACTTHYRETQADARTS
jgi:hypothetical protein